MIRTYQKLLSPLLGQRCRFYPSCSQYTLEAIQEWGLVKGVYLGTKRICRCHPLNEGGIDPVPRKDGSHLKILEDFAEVQPSSSSNSSTMSASDTPSTASTSASSTTSNELEANKPKQKS